MATPEQRAAFDAEVAKLAPRLKDSPVQAGTLIARAMERHNIHSTELSLTAIDGVRERLAQYERDNRVMERWFELRSRVGYGCPWDVFFKACARKVNVSEAWRGKIGEVVGADVLRISYYERFMQEVPYEWLERVMALPDLDPNAFVPRSNYAEVCEPLESTLKAAGKSASWIAETLTAFLARFNGTRVTTADVRFPKQRKE